MYYRIFQLKGFAASAIAIAALVSFASVPGHAAPIGKGKNPGFVDCDIVDGPSINEVLAAGVDDLTVVGTCTENVEISQPGVILNGNGIATLTGDGTGPAISVTANNVVIADWAAIEGGAANGILVDASGSVEISNIASIKGARGVVVRQAAFANILSSSLSNSTGVPGYGLVAITGGHARLEGSEVSGNARRGIVIANAGTVDLAGGNLIDGNVEEGIIILHGVLAITGTGNTASGNGALLENARDVECFDFSRISISNSFANSDGTFFSANCVLSLGPPLFTPAP